MALDVPLQSCDFIGQPASESAKTASSGKDSELALLMRKIHEDSRQLRVLIENNESLAREFPDYLNDLTTATPTDSEVKGELFNKYCRTGLLVEAVTHLIPLNDSINEMPEPTGIVAQLGQSKHA